jgi:hypothetical protein
MFVGRSYAIVLNDGVNEQVTGSGYGGKKIVVADLMPYPRI